MNSYRSRNQYWLYRSKNRSLTHTCPRIDHEHTNCPGTIDEPTLVLEPVKNTHRSWSLSCILTGTETYNESMSVLESINNSRLHFFLEQYLELFRIWIRNDTRILVPSFEPIQFQFQSTNHTPLSKNI